MTSWKNNNALESKKLTEEALENEIKTVSYWDHREALDALQRKYQKTPVNIFEVRGHLNYLKKEPIRLGINWSTLGTVEVEEAEEFMAVMQQAIEDCKNYKYNGYTIVE